MKKDLSELKNMELVTNGYQVFLNYSKDYIDFDFYEYCLGGRVLTNDTSTNNIIDNILINDIMREDFNTLYYTLECNGYKFSELSCFDDLQSVIFDNVDHAKNELIEQGFLLKTFKSGIFYLTVNDSFANDIIKNAYNFIHNEFNIVDKIELFNNHLFIKDKTSVQENIIFNAEKVNAYNAVSILLSGYNNISLSIVYDLINSRMVDVVKSNNVIYVVLGNMVKYYNVFKLNTKTLSFDKVTLNKNAIRLLYANSEKLNEYIAINAIRKKLSNSIIPALENNTIKKDNKVVRLDNIMINGSPFYLLSNDSIQLFTSDNRMINVVPYNGDYLISFK